MKFEPKGYKLLIKQLTKAQSLNTSPEHHMQLIEFAFLVQD